MDNYSDSASGLRLHKWANRAAGQPIPKFPRGVHLQPKEVQPGEEGPADEEDKQHGKATAAVEVMKMLYPVMAATVMLMALVSEKLWTLNKVGRSAGCICSAGVSGFPTRGLPLSSLPTLNRWTTLF